MGELLAFSVRPSGRVAVDALASAPPAPPAPPVRPAEPEPLWRELVGARLREARTAAGRTLGDVAREAGISLPYLSEIERGRKEPSSEVLAAVAGALGLGLVDLTAAVTRTLASSALRDAGPRGPVALAV